MKGINFLSVNISQVETAHKIKSVLIKTVALTICLLLLYSGLNFISISLENRLLDLKKQQSLIDSELTKYSGIEKNNLQLLVKLGKISELLNHPLLPESLLNMILAFKMPGVGAGFVRTNDGWQTTLNLNGNYLEEIEEITKKLSDLVLSQKGSLALLSMSREAKGQLVVSYKINWKSAPSL